MESQCIFGYIWGMGLSDSQRPMQKIIMVFCYDTPYAPCIEYLPTFTLKITHSCR